MIDSKQHALEILKIVLPRKNDEELQGLFKLALVQGKNGTKRIDEDKFWNDIILSSKEGSAFIKSRRITILEELILAHYEWKMKYQWNIYKNISSSIDSTEDELDSSIYLD